MIDQEKIKQILRSYKSNQASIFLLEGMKSSLKFLTVKSIVFQQSMMVIYVLL